MDLTILYRVLWKPNAVFKEIIGKMRVEPLIFISATIVIPLISDNKNIFYMGCHTVAFGIDPNTHHIEKTNCRSPIYPDINRLDYQRSLENICCHDVQ